MLRESFFDFFRFPAPEPFGAEGGAGSFNDADILD